MVETYTHWSRKKAHHLTSVIESIVGVRIRYGRELPVPGEDGKAPIDKVISITKCRFQKMLADEKCSFWGGQKTSLLAFSKKSEELHTILSNATR